MPKNNSKARKNWRKARARLRADGTMKTQPFSEFLITLEQAADASRPGTAGR